MQRSGLDMDDRGGGWEFEFRHALHEPKLKGLYRRDMDVPEQASFEELRRKQRALLQNRFRPLIVSARRLKG